MFSASGHPRWERVCFFTETELEKFSITAIAHQWILCSEWVPSEWESKQLINHHNNPQVIQLSEKLSELQYMWNMHRSSRLFSSVLVKTFQNTFIQICWWREQLGIKFFIRGRVIMHYVLSLKLNKLKYWWICFLQTHIQLFTSQDVNCWTGVVWINCRLLLWCVYHLFGLSFWWHPFTAGDPLVSKWCNSSFIQICSNEETN